MWKWKFWKIRYKSGRERFDLGQCSSHRWCQSRHAWLAATVCSAWGVKSGHFSFAVDRISVKTNIQFANLSFRISLCEKWQVLLDYWFLISWKSPFVFITSCAFTKRPVVDACGQLKQKQAPQQESWLEAASKHRQWVWQGSFALLQCNIWERRTFPVPLLLLCSHFGMPWDSSFAWKNSQKKNPTFSEGEAFTQGRSFKTCIVLAVPNNHCPALITVNPLAWSPVRMHRCRKATHRSLFPPSGFAFIINVVASGFTISCTPLFFCPDPRLSQPTSPHGARCRNSAAAEGVAGRRPHHRGRLPGGVPPGCLFECTRSKHFTSTVHKHF